MPQVLRCPHCQKSMQVPDNVAGKQVRCPSCTKAFTVPAAAPVAAALAPAVSAPAAAATNGKAAAPAGGAPTKCPACGAALLEGAVSCMDCGFLVQSEAAA